MIKTLKRSNNLTRYVKYGFLLYKKKKLFVFQITNENIVKQMKITTTDPKITIRCILFTWFFSDVVNIYFYYTMV